MLARGFAVNCSCNSIPEKAVIACREQFELLLQLRYSSPLFRLPSAAAIKSQVHFWNTGPHQVHSCLFFVVLVSPSPSWCFSCMPVCFCRSLLFALSEPGDNTHQIPPTEPKNPPLVDVYTVCSKAISHCSSEGTCAVCHLLLLDPGKTVSGNRSFDIVVCVLPQTKIIWRQAFRDLVAAELSLWQQVDTHKFTPADKLEACKHCPTLH